MTFDHSHVVLSRARANLLEHALPDLLPRLLSRPRPRFDSRALRRALLHARPQRRTLVGAGTAVGTSLEAAA